jgi:hypothetical protein
MMLMACGSNKISFLHFHTSSPTTLVFHNLLYFNLPPHLILIPAHSWSHMHMQRGGFVVGLLTVKWVTLVVYSKWCGWPFSFMWCGVAETASCHLCCFSSALCCWLLDVHSTVGDQWRLALNVPQSCHFPTTQLCILPLHLLFGLLLNLSGQPVINYCPYMFSHP